MLQRPRVLIVDDDPQFVNLLSHIARSRCLVRTATNGEEAMSAISRFLPDLIITDLEMPECDGLELIARVRSTTRTELIPIIVLTSNSESERVKAAGRLGISNYVLKTSLQPNDLLTMISFVLNRDDMLLGRR